MKFAVNPVVLLCKVALFIKKTVLPEIFYEIITSNPIALKQYTFSLEQFSNHKDLAELYKYQKNLTEAYVRILCENNFFCVKLIQVKNGISSQPNTLRQFCARSTRI
jgi:hypothetical protein